MSGLRVLICGGRDYTNYEALAQELRLIDIAVIGHGAARGADSLADQYARHHFIPVRQFPADWQQHGRAAGPIRNALMLREFQPDVVVACPGGRGTAHMVGLAEKAGIPIRRLAEVSRDPE